MRPMHSPSVVFPAILTIVIFAAINRFRGGGIIPERLFNPPGHRRFWATPLVASVAALWLSPTMALAFGACWLLWALLPWGRWYTCGRGLRSWSGEPDAFERVVEAVVRGLTGFTHIGCPPMSRLRVIDDHLCLAARNVLVLMPLALLFGPTPALIVLIGMAASYELAWRLVPEVRGPTGYAEWATGAWWGAALVLST